MGAQSSLARPGGPESLVFTRSIKKIIPLDKGLAEW